MSTTVLALLCGFAFMVGIHSYYDLKSNSENSGMSTTGLTLLLLILGGCSFFFDIIPWLVFAAKATAFIGIIFGGNFITGLLDGFLSAGREYRDKVFIWKGEKQKLLQSYSTVDPNNENNMITWNREMEAVDLAKPRRW
jgi:hypothetical protein